MKRLLWKVKMFFLLDYNPIYFDPQTHNFVQVKSSADDGLSCGGFRKFYSDAQTTIIRQKLSYDYIYRCKEIHAVDKSPYAKLNTSLKAWEVKA